MTQIEALKAIEEYEAYLQAKLQSPDAIDLPSHGFLSTLISHANRLSQTASTLLQDPRIANQRRKAPLPKNKAIKNGEYLATFDVSEMGTAFLGNLARLGAEVFGKFQVVGLKPFDLSTMLPHMTTPKARNKGLFFFVIQHQKFELGSGNEDPHSKQQLISKLDTQPNNNRFSLPDFTNIPIEPPVDSAEQAFASFIASAGTTHGDGATVGYYVGPSLTVDFDSLLPPGRLSDIIGNVPGMTTPYWHAGPQGSGTSFHFEDGSVRSSNLTIAGFKFWILIDPSSKQKFERLVEELELYDATPSQNARCEQWVRHLGVLIAPRLLKKHDIGYQCILAGPGDLVVTSPGQYHAVVNLTTNLAVSINFILPEDNMFPEPIIACPRCALHEIKHANIQKTRYDITKHLHRQPGTLVPSKRERKRKRADKSVLGKSPVIRQEKMGRHSSRLRRLAERIAESEATSLQEDEAADASHQRSSNQGTAGKQPSTSRSESETSNEEEHELSEELAGNQSRNTESGDREASVSTSEDARSICLGERSTAHNDISSPSTPSMNEFATSAAAEPAGLLAEIDAVIKETLQRDPECNIPDFTRQDPPPVDVLRLVVRIRSRVAISQFCDLVTDRRRLDPYAFSRFWDPVQHEKNAAKQLQLLCNFQNNKMQRRATQRRFAMSVIKARDGNRGVSSDIKKNILEITGLTHEQYESSLRAGQQWHRLCGEKLEGILPFIPVTNEKMFGVSQKDYLMLAEPKNSQNLEWFHQLLDDQYTRTICKAGKAFEDALFSSDVLFSWELSKHGIWDTLYEDKEEVMLSLIRPLPWLWEDKYSEAESPGWPDPTRSPPREGASSSTNNSRACSVCSRVSSGDGSCECYPSQDFIATHMLSRVRIKRFHRGQDGLGLQAMSEEGSGIAFKENEIIGYLTGKLLKPGAYNHGAESQSRLVLKSDDDYQLDCSQEGSLFRLARTQCHQQDDANAGLEARYVSGRRRLAIVATKNIHAGSEILGEWEWMRLRKHRPGCECPF